MLDDNINQEEEENNDAWLVSYADMMTLIACFFILMVAFANFDPVGFNKKAKELSKSFNQGKYKPSKTKLETLTEEIVKHPTLKKKSKITKHDEEVLISFSGSVLFEKGGTIIKEETLVSLDVLIDIIRTKDPNYRIIIEGHTDPFEHKLNPNIDSPWELGAIRAAKILARFEYLGFAPKKLLATTKGSTIPIEEPMDSQGNPIEENNISNRRVLIKVLEPKRKKQKLKFGLGVYFDD